MDFLIVLMKNRFLKIVLGEAVLILMMCFIFMVVNIIPSKMTMETTSNSPEIFRKLGETEVFKESFKAKNNNLNRIDVLFKNPNLESRDELEIILKDLDNQIISQQKFSGFNLGDTSHARMDFVPIVDSRGKQYFLEILPTKIVDGKLGLGIKGEKIDFIQYYNSDVNLAWAAEKTMTIIENIFNRQPIVFFLPMMVLGMFLW